jgi:hypothetical protein
MMNQLIEGKDYYCENGLIVFTREFHLKRGACCGSGCRHCPYQPRGQQGNQTIAVEEQPFSESDKLSDHNQ